MEFLDENTSSSHTQSDKPNYVTTEGSETLCGITEHAQRKRLAATNMAAGSSNVEGASGRDADEDDEESIDLGLSKVPEVHFPSSRNEFETINLDADGDDEDEDDPSDSHSDEKRKKKRCKRKKKRKQLLLNYTDSSSEDEARKKKDLDEMNPSELNWPLWVWYYIMAISTGALHVAEYLGEKLAAFFGITTPKYQYVIDEYYRMKELEREEEESEKREREYAAKLVADNLAKLEGGAASTELKVDIDSATSIPLVLGNNSSNQQEQKTATPDINSSHN